MAANDPFRTDVIQVPAIRTETDLCAKSAHSRRGPIAYVSALRAQSLSGVRFVRLARPHCSREGLIEIGEDVVDVLDAD